MLIVAFLMHVATWSLIMSCMVCESEVSSTRPEWASRCAKSLSWRVCMVLIFYLKVLSANMLSRREF